MYNGHSENQVVLTHMSIMIHVYIYEEHFTLHNVSPQNMAKVMNFKIIPFIIINKV